MRFYNFEMKLLPMWQTIVEREVSIWERFYQPLQAKGKTVLDLGAGCGETAAFYLARGAKKVICVEPDPDAFKMLKENIDVNGMEAEAIKSRFELEQLSIAHEFLKMDIEGGEAALYDYEGLLDGPVVIESHGDITSWRLMRDLNLKRVYRMSEVGAAYISLLHDQSSNLPEYRSSLGDYVSVLVFAAKVKAGELLNVIRV